MMHSAAFCLVPLFCINCFVWAARNAAKRLADRCPAEPGELCRRRSLLNASRTRIQTIHRIQPIRPLDCQSTAYHTWFRVLDLSRLAESLQPHSLTTVNLRPSTQPHRQPQTRSLHLSECNSVLSLAPNSLESSAHAERAHFAALTVRASSSSHSWEHAAGHLALAVRSSTLARSRWRAAAKPLRDTVPVSRSDFLVLTWQPRSSREFWVPLHLRRAPRPPRSPAPARARSGRRCASPYATHRASASKPRLPPQLSGR